MSKIYVIKECSFGGYSNIIGAVSDERTAKRFCRDKRTDKELCYEPVELDAPEMTDVEGEKIYKVVKNSMWTFEEKDSVVEAYKHIEEMNPIPLVEVEDFLTVAYASLRTLRLTSDHNGTRLEFWCYAKSAPAAKNIIKRQLRGFDPSVLEWGVYHPIRKDNKELKRRMDELNKLNKQLKQK